MDFKKSYQPYFFFKSFFLHFVYSLCVRVCACWPSGVQRAACRNPASPSTVWVPGIKLRCGCQACRQAPPPTEPSCWPLSWVVLKQGLSALSDGLSGVEGRRQATGRGGRRSRVNSSSGHELSLFLSHRCDTLDIFFRKKVPVFLPLQVHASPAHRIRSVWGLH